MRGMYSYRPFRIQPDRERGAATIEYSIVVALFVLALIANPNVVVELIDAVKRIFQAFTFAISMSYPSPSL